MNPKRLFPPMLMAALACWPLLSSARPRPPLPPWPEVFLQRLTFDEPYALPAGTGAERSPSIDASTWVESWSGYALNRQDDHLNPVIMPMVTTEQWNVAPDAGIIRFWYKSEWTAPGVMANGGPGHYARLAELITTTDKKHPVVFWSLYFSPDGTQLYLSGDGASGPVDYLKASISWDNSWHLVALSYGPEETSLWLDGALAALGQGIPSVPMAAAGLTSLVIGSDASGRNTAAGQIEEFTTFVGELPMWQTGFAWYFQATWETAAQGPISAEEDAAWLQQAAELQALRDAGLVAQKPAMHPMLLELETGFYFLTPELSGTNVNLTLENGETNKAYNLLFSPVLPASYWSTAIIGTMGQTNFTVPLSNYAAFFRAEEGDDWDGDGIKNWEDADPSDPDVGILQVTIEAPEDDSVIH